MRCEDDNMYTDNNDLLVYGVVFLSVAFHNKVIILHLLLEKGVISY